MITKQEIEAKKTANGGWTKDQLAQWGVPWPPEKNWLKKLISGEPVLSIPVKSKTKMKREAGRVAMRNKALMCRIWINSGFRNPYGLKNDKIAANIIEHFDLDISGKNKVSEIVDWASFTSPSLLMDTRPATKARAKIRSKASKEYVASYDAISRPSNEIKTAFYASWEWRTLRKEVLNQYGARCQCCGATPADVDIGGKPVRIVVDHIKPLARYWSLRLDRTNLQILCDECNQGAGAWDETDHRPV